MPVVWNSMARLWSALRVLLGVLILAALAWRLGSGAFSNGLWLTLNIRAVAAALGIGFLTTALSAARWCLVARRLGLPLSFGRALEDCYRATFLNAVLPAGVLGDVGRAVRHGRDVGQVGRGVRAVVLERTAGQVVVLLAGAAVLLANPSLSAAVAHDVGAGPVGAIILTLGALAAAVAVLATVRGWGTATRWRQAVADTCNDVRNGLLACDVWPKLVLLSAAALAGHLALFVVAARVGGTSAPASELVPLLVLALVAMGLPINVAGWGPREGMAALAFAAAGLSAAQGLTIAVIYGLLAFVASLPGAAALLLFRGDRGRGQPLQIELEERVVAKVDAAHRGT